MALMPVSSCRATPAWWCTPCRSLIMIENPIVGSRCLSMIMPVYNEGSTVLQIIDDVFAQG